MRRTNGALLFACLAAAAGCVAPIPPPDPAPDTRPPKAPPAVIESPEDKLWKPEAKERAWKMIVIHHTAFENGSAATIDALHKRKGWDGLGYHFVIGNGSLTKDGQVEVGWRWKSQREGAHCRIHPYDDNRFNRTGIGICLIGDFERRPPSRAQMASLDRLAGWLQKRYRIPAGQVKRHSDIKATDCPGHCFTWASFQKRLTQNPAPPKNTGP